VPFKSERQRAWAAEQVKSGKWSQAQFDEWNRETPANIPERAPGASPKTVKTVKTAKVIK
jgi:hypothetical protein